MSWAHVQGVSAQTTSGVNALTVTIGSTTGVTVGDMLVTGFASYPNGAVAVTASDNKSNTWVHDTTHTATGNAAVFSCIAHSVVTTGGAVAVTWTYASSDFGYSGMTVDEYSFTGSLSVDTVVSTASSTTTTPSCGSLAVTGNDMIYGTLGFSSSSTVTPNTGFNSRGYLNYTSNTVGICSEDYLNATTAKIASWTMGTSAICYYAAVAYKTPAAAAALPSSLNISQAMKRASYY